MKWYFMCVAVLFICIALNNGFGSNESSEDLSKQIEQQKELRKLQRENDSLTKVRDSFKERLNKN